MVQNNAIGTGVNGTELFGNGEAGVIVEDASSVGIFGNIIGDARSLASDDGNGIRLRTTSVTPDGTNITGNLIGVGSNGTADLGNARRGISITAGSNTAITNNIISGNGGAGIEVSSHANLSLLGNRIGTSGAGNAPLANGANGVVISAGDTDFTNNIISGNTGHGVSLGPAAGATEFHGNFIGQGAASTDQIPNTQDGIHSEADDVIVGTWPGPDNVIRYNGGFGIVVDGGIGNTIRGNLMGANSAGFPHGIDLRNGGNDNVPEPDNLQILVGSSAAPPYTLRFQTFGSLACYNGAAAGTCIVDVYTASTNQEGEAPAQAMATSNTVDGPGFQTIVLPPSVRNTRILITITDGANTSQFSSSVMVPP